jgi:hypothetical protein
VLTWSDQAEKFLSSPILWGVLAVVALAFALSAKLSVTATTVLMWIAYALAVFGGYRLVIGWDLIFRLLSTGALACILAMVTIATIRWLNDKPLSQSAPPVTGANNIQKPPSLLAEAFKHRPEVGLRFVYPKSPALIITNKSPSLARDITWTVALWNMNHPERVQQLPIPVSTLGWVKPDDESGPINLFDDPHVTELLSPGDRLFGMAAVTCVPCRRGRTYVLSMIWGESGWYSETEASGEALLPGFQTKEALDGYFRSLEELAPLNSRNDIASEKTPTRSHATLTLSVQLQLQPGKLYFVNNGANDFNVWGTKFGEDKVIDSVGRLVKTGQNLSFDIPNPAIIWVQDHFVPKGKGIMPVEIYLTDASQKNKFTGQFTVDMYQQGDLRLLRTLSFGVIENGW